EPLVPAIHPAIPGRGTALVEAVIGPEPAPVIGRGDGAHPVLGDVRAGGQGGHHDEGIQASAPMRAGGSTHRHRQNMAALPERAIEMTRDDAARNAMAPASLDSSAHPGGANARL